MAYLLIEGFEIYPNINSSADGLQGRWLSTGGYGNYNTGSGRFGGQCIQAQGSSNFNGAVQFALTPVGSGTSTFALGFAYFMAAVTPPNIIAISLLNGGASSSPSAGILGIGINPSQQPYIYVGSYEKSYNNLQPNLPIAGATSSTVMPTGSWHYFELVGTINSTTGSLILYQDGVQVAQVTGNTGVQTADTLNLGATNYYISPGYFDDIYVTNTAVRVGERRVQTLAVNADNSVTWASNAGSNYSQINSVPVQASPSTNVNTQTIGATDLYNVNHLTGVPTAISAVQLHIVGSKVDVGTRIVAPVIKSGSTEVVGANAALTNSYQHFVNVYNTDPNTGSAWTANSVNAVVIGQTLVA